MVFNTEGTLTVAFIPTQQLENFRVEVIPSRKFAVEETSSDFKAIVDAKM